MDFFEIFERIYKGDDEIVDKVYLSEDFLLDYISQDLGYDKYMQKLNILAHKIPKKRWIRILTLIMGVKNKRFFWNNTFINFSVKKKEKEEFKEKIKKYFNWSEREYKENEIVLKNNIEEWADFLGIENEERKRLGLKRININLDGFKDKRQKNLERWFIG